MDQTCFCYNGKGELCFRYDGAECIDCEHFCPEGREAHALAEEVEQLRAVLNGALTDIQTARRIAYEGGNIENTLAVTAREIQDILEGRE